MKAQRAITEINRYKGWRAEKYIKNKAARTGYQFKERTNISSRETENKDERTCYTCKKQATKKQYQKEQDSSK